MFLFYNALLSVIFFLLRENVNALMVFLCYSCTFLITVSQKFILPSLSNCLFTSPAIREPAVCVFVKAL